MKIVTNNGETTYQCEECGFHYWEREWAEKCEVWCREYHTCNIEITDHAEESNVNSSNESNAS